MASNLTLQLPLRKLPLVESGRGGADRPGLSEEGRGLRRCLPRQRGRSAGIFAGILINKQEKKRETYKEEIKKDECLE